MKMICFTGNPDYGLENKIILNFESKLHDSCLMRWVQNIFSQNDTIWQQLYLTPLSFYRTNITHIMSGVASSIPAWYHTFVEIDHEIISSVILLPSADALKKGCCQL